MIDVSVLIVSYNTRELLRCCLASIAAAAPTAEAEIIVVDNASADGSAAMVATTFPEVTLVASTENLGFARGVNVAAQKASGEYLLLLNPDTEAHAGSIDRLVAFARAKPRFGLYGGRTVTPAGEVDPRSCWGLQTTWSLFCFATGLSSVLRRNAWFDPESLGRWDRDDVREVGALSGSLLLVPRAVWEELGGLDERFWMYGEDVDLALRARRKGYRPVVTPDASITHVVGASSETSAGKTTMVLRGRATLLRKHGGAVARPLGLALLVIGVALRAAASRALRTVRPEAAGRWTAVWAERRVWARGYPSET